MGFVLGMVYLVVPWTTPYFVGVIHWTMIPAMFTIAIAIANTLSRRPRE